MKTALSLLGVLCLSLFVSTSHSSAAPKTPVQIYYAFPDSQRDILFERHCNNENDKPCRQKITNTIADCKKITPAFTKKQKGKIAYYLRMHKCVDVKIDKKKPVPDEYIKTFKDMEKSRLHYIHCDKSTQYATCHLIVNQVVDQHFQQNKKAYQNIKKGDNKQTLKNQLDKSVQDALQKNKP